MTALHAAAFNGHVAIVRLLLEKGASPNICDKVQHFICSKGEMDGGGGGGGDHSKQPPPLATPFSTFSLIPIFTKYT